jgi:hypothetical protein
MLVWFFILLGALAERLRGGFPALGAPGSDEGAGRARAVRAAVWMVIAATVTLRAGESTLIVLAVALWTAVGAFLALANSHRECWLVRTPGEAAAMLGLGLLRFGLSAAPLLAWAVWRSGELVALLSLGVAFAHPALYWLCWRLPLPRIGRALDAGNAYAEYGWGGAQLAALLLAFAL